MTTRSTIATALFALITVISLVGQGNLQKLPDDFEFLDHRRVRTDLVAMEPLDEGVLYVSGNGTNSPQASGVFVNLALYDNSHIEYYSSFDFPGHGFSLADAKIFVLNDSITEVILYNLVDFDISAPGFVKLRFNDEVLIAVESFLRSEIDNIGIFDIVRDSSETYWAIDTDLLKIENDTISARFPIDNIISLHTNNQGELFGYKNSFFGNDTLFVFDGQVFSPHVSLGQTVLGASSVGDQNLVYTNDNAFLYDSGFDILVAQWPLPSPFSSEENMYFEDGQLYMTFGNATTNLNEIWILDTNGNHQILLQSTEVAEDWRDLRVLSDSLFFISGTKSIDPITFHPFFRALPRFNDTTYNRLDVDVISFVIEVVSADATGNNTDYKLDYTIQNNSLDTLRLGSAHSSLFDLTSLPFSYSMAFQDLAPNEMQSYSDTINHIKGNLSHVSLGVTGANFRINDGQSLPVDFMTSVETLEGSATTVLYPNPATDYINLDQHNPPAAYVIYEQSGHLLRQSQGEKNFSIDVSNFLPGIYFLRILDVEQKTVSIHKFFKH